MENRTRKIFSVLPVIAMTLCLAGCQEEIDPGQNPGNPDGNKVRLTFTVGSSTADTKASTAKTIKPEVVDQILISEEGEQPLYLEASVMNVDDTYFNSRNVVTTKGTPNYTENFAKLHQTFDGVYYDGTTAKNITFNNISDGAPFRYAADIPAVAAKSNLMFLNAVDGGTTLENAGVKNLKYNKSTYGSIEFDYTSPEEAVNQKDILFTTRTVAEDATDVSVLFYHALTGVKFKAGNYGDNITTIDKISLTGLMTSGHCTVTPTYEQEGYNWEGHSNGNDQTKKVAKSATVSLWKDCTGGGNNSNFTVQNLGVIEDDPAGNKFPANFGGGKDYDKNNIMDEDYKNTFYFIPQNTGGNKVILTVEYTVKHVDPATKEVIEQHSGKRQVYLGQDWKAGELWTYTLTAKDIDVTVTDTVSGKQKSNVVIRNTGNADAYIRAAIIGNWQYAAYRGANHSKEQIKGNNSWEFDPNQFSGLDNDSWVLGSDGFFYYKYIVKAGDETRVKLFDTYTFTDGPAKCELILDVMAQAVDVAKIKDAGWPFDEFSDQYDEEVNGNQSE